MIQTLRIIALSALIALSACSQPAAEAPPLAEGDWMIDPAASRLSYISIKAGDIAETNGFEALSGSVAANGSARVEIDLSSVSTGIDIRNERMREIFFNVAENPKAVVTAQLDPATFANLGIGQSIVQPLTATVNLKGVESTVDTELQVTRVGADRVLAVSTAPVIVSAGAFGLIDELDQLREIAGLPSITPAVPVTFTLAFTRS